MDSRLPESPNAPPDEATLFEAVQDARDARFRENDATRSHHRALVGECDQNAVALARECHRRGWDVWIHLGGMDVDLSPRPECRADTHRDGTAHYWCELPSPDGEGRVLADVSAEVPDRVGEPVVRSAYPETYVPFVAVRFYPWMDAGFISNRDALGRYETHDSTGVADLFTEAR